MRQSVTEFRAPVVVVRPAFPKHAAVDLQWVSGVDAQRIYLSGGLEVRAPSVRPQHLPMTFVQGNVAWSPTVYVWCSPGDYELAVEFFWKQLHGSGSRVTKLPELLRTHNLSGNPFGIFSRRCGDATKVVSVRGLRVVLPAGAPAVCQVLLPKGQGGDQLTFHNAAALFR